MSERRPEDRAYFFDEGLRFSCTSCGRCCSGSPGLVRISENEMTEAAAVLGQPLDDLQRTVFRHDPTEGWLVVERENGDCVFLEGGRFCRIYASRPLQCRTYPFWPKLIRSETAWKEEKARCPGIGQGRLYSRGEILHLAENSPF